LRSLDTTSNRVVSGRTLGTTAVFSEHRLIVTPRQVPDQQSPFYLALPGLFASVFSIEVTPFNAQSIAISVTKHAARIMDFVAMSFIDAASPGKSRKP